MMDQEFKAKWVEALRSGEYKQGRGYLKVTENGEARYCCLGVACELLRESGVDVTWEKGNSGGPNSDPNITYFSAYAEGVGSGGILPSSLAARIGTGRDPVVVISETTRGFSKSLPFAHTEFALSTLNDNGVPFSEIANLIEEHL